MNDVASEDAVMDAAERCDSCGQYLTGAIWAVPTGRRDEQFNAPIVELYCDPCYQTQEST